MQSTVTEMDNSSKTVFEGKMRCQVATCFIRPWFVPNQGLCVRYENENNHHNQGFNEKITANSQTPLQYFRSLKSSLENCLY